MSDLIGLYARRLVRRAVLRKLCYDDADSVFSAKEEILNIEDNLVDMAKASLMEAILILNINYCDTIKRVKINMVKKLNSYVNDIDQDILEKVKLEIWSMDHQDILPNVH